MFRGQQDGSEIVELKEEVTGKIAEVTVFEYAVRLHDSCRNGSSLRDFEGK